MQNVSLNLCKNWSTQDCDKNVRRNIYLMIKFVYLFNQIEEGLGSCLNTIPWFIYQKLSLKDSAHISVLAEDS